MFTEKQLAEILEVCEKLPKGPWEWVEDKFHGGYSGLVDAENKEVLFPNCCNDGDEGAAWFEDYATPEVRHFITLARTALPQLADEIIKLREKYEQPNPKCGKGHENTLPLALWDCPMCTEELTEENTKLRAVAEAAYVLQKHLDLYDPRIYTRDRDELRNALTAAGYGGD